ncbi:MAG: hypothetical protein GX369_00695 [Euryarchaeota archaeon]|nr:hypothetical protein [Euryarchaeota archaeon]
MRAVGFCPGHITGLFYPCMHEDVLSSGSRGAGMCINLGAKSEVVINHHGEVRVSLKHGNGSTCVTKTAIMDMLPPGIGAYVNTSLELPMGCGFGMSAAGALSATIALSNLLNLPRQHAFEAAHRAEIINHGGLGDVAGLMAGGVEMRRREGIPPVGEVVRLADKLDLVACVVGPRMFTSTILESEGHAISRIGKRYHRKLLQNPTIDRFLELCREFAEDSGIITAPVRKALNELNNLGPCSMTMLGNSVFATGDLDEQERVLRKYGSTYRLHLDLEGPRIIHTE